MATILHPIRKEAIDKQLYLLVKIVMMMRSIKAYNAYSPEYPDEEQMNLKQLAYQLKKDHVFLIYPLLHRQFRMYPQEITNCPVIIAVYKDKYLIHNNQDQRDIEYKFNCFYTLDFKENDDTQLVLTSHATEDQGEGLPVFYDNTKELLQAINQLLDLISITYSENNEWYKRLQEARMMLLNREDGIRILHNMGFFDSESLMQMLIDCQADKQEQNDVISAYIDNLKIFAMLVVNGLYDKIYDYQKSYDKPHATPLPTLKPQPKPQPKPASTSDKKTVIAPISRVATQSQTASPTPKSQESHKNNSRRMRWQYRQEVIHAKETRPTLEDLKAASDFGEQKKQQEENNSRILRNIVIYAGAMLLLVGALLLAKYSITGSATISVGVISGIIMRNIARLKEGYVEEDPQPRWFIVSIAFGCIFFVFGGMLACKWLSRYIYDVTDGSITPWGFFGIVFVFAMLLFIYARKVRKYKTGKEARLYICLMFFSICLIISQCTGSLSSAQDINHEEWRESMEDWDKKNDDWNRQYKNSKNAENKKMIEGKWIYNVFLDMKTFDEEFMADGTWQRNDSSVVICKGQWECVDGDKVKMSVTWVNQEADYKPDVFDWTMVIHILNEKKFTSFVGERFENRTRKKCVVE